MKLVAEVGTHHRNDLNLAKKYIEQASRAGCWAVKFQFYTADRLSAICAKAYWETTQTQYEVFKEIQPAFTLEEWKILIEHCKRNNIVFMISIFDHEAVKDFYDIGCRYFKIASSDCTYGLLYQEYRKIKNISIFISVGATDENDFNYVVKQITLDVNSTYEFREYAIMHCSLSYPAMPSELNLNRIYTIRNRFMHMDVGYSDHLHPIEFQNILPILLEKGVTYIEKHFTLDPELPNEDHYHSMTLSDISEYQRIYYEWVLMNGNGNHMIMPSEYKARHRARRVAIASKDIQAGHNFTYGNVEFLRNHAGIDYNTFIGRFMNTKSYRNIKKGEPI